MWLNAFYFWIKIGTFSHMELTHVANHLLFFFFFFHASKGSCAVNRVKIVDADANIQHLALSCCWVSIDGALPNRLKFTSFHFTLNVLTVRSLIRIKCKVWKQVSLSIRVPSLSAFSLSASMAVFSLSLSLSQFSHQGTFGRCIKPSPPFEGKWSDFLSLSSSL
jgi:hypothetical protein